MNNHIYLSDNQFEKEFEACTLPPSLFSHEAHIRLAWIHIRKYGVDTAVENICNQLQQYVIQAGASDKYNITLTIAAIKIVNHFVEKSNSDDFLEFITEFPLPITGFKELVAAHYNKVDIFKSLAAKSTFWEPDIAF